MSERITRRGQISLGVLWLIDGILQFQPYMFGRSFVTGVLLPSAAGQPSFLGAPITWVAHLIEPHAAVFNAFAASLEVLIGIGLLHRPTVKPALAISFAWALGIWFAGEGIGMLFTGEADPLTGAPGAALLYVVAGLLCWPRQPQGRSSREGGNPGPIGDRGARVVSGAVWIGCAVLWLLPANRRAGAAHDAIAGAPSGAGWLSRLLDAIATATAHRGTTIAIVLAVASATIGLAILYAWHRRTFLVIQIGLMGLYWVAGQGLGGIFTGQATDVGTAPLMILVAVMVAERSAYTRRRVRAAPRRTAAFSVSAPAGRQAPPRVDSV
jgi:hypothetical protein